MMVVSGVVAGVLIFAAIHALTGFSFFTPPQRTDVSADEASGADITMLAYSVLGYIVNEDFAALSRIVHPEHGVVMSPCATINLNTDRRFSAEHIASLSLDTSVYIWGVVNGSGKPIELTPAGYFTEFVPAARHMDATTIGINTIVRSGNALENIEDVFPDVRFVDFHIQCGEPIEEFGWSSLRLGFMEHRGNLRLILISYSTWEI
jgi:hypothetical protein